MKYFAVLLALASEVTYAQAPVTDAGEAKTVVIQFKVFDANDPRIEFHPDLASPPIIYLRNLDTNEDEIYLGEPGEDVPVIRESKDRKGFYEIVMPRNRLINELAIDLLEPNTNVASMIKIVTANNIVLYPGASKSREPFTFTGYMAQLNRYHSLMTQLTEQFWDRRSEISNVLISRYASNLIDMQWVLDNNMVDFSYPEHQQLAARTTLNEVLDLYGIQPTVPTPKPSNVVYQQAPTYRCAPVQCRQTYYRRPRLFCRR